MNTARIYAGLLSLITLICGWVLSAMNPSVLRRLEYLPSYPTITLLAVKYHSWPYWIAAIGVIGFALTFIDPKTKSLVERAAFLLMAGSLLLMLINLTGLVTAFIVSTGPIQAIE